MCWIEGGRNREKDEGAEAWREREKGGRQGRPPSLCTTPAHSLSQAVPPQVALLIPRPGSYTRAST